MRNVPQEVIVLVLFYTEVLYFGGIAIAILSNTFDLQLCVKTSGKKLPQFPTAEECNQTSCNVRMPLERFYGKLGIEFANFL
jgi:hypothetical protein